MKEKLQAWADRIDQLALRERVLLLLAAVSVLAAAFNALALAPLAQAQQHRAQTLQQLRAQVSDEARRLTRPGQADGPLQARRRRIKALQGELEAAARALRGRLGTLVQPADAPRVLRDLVRRQPGLRLVGLRSRLHRRERPTGGQHPQRSDPFQAAGVERYDIVLHLRGSYMSTLHYLQALEHLRWRLFWQRVALKVRKHPVSDVTLEVYTLGEQGS